MKWILLYSVSSLILQILGDTLGFFHENNLPIFYLIIWTSSFCIFSYFLSHSLLLKEKVTKLTIGVIILAYVLVFLCFEKLSIYYPYSAILEGVLVFVLCLVYLNNELENPKSDRIMSQPDFWIACGFLVYYGSSWLILLSSHYFIKDSNTFVNIWRGQNGLNIIKNILITIGLYKYRWR